MPKRRSKRRKPNRPVKLNARQLSRLEREVLGLLWLTLGGFLLLCFASGLPAASFVSGGLPGMGIPNLGGTLGAWLAEFLLGLFGKGAWLFPLTAFLFAGRLLRNRPARIRQAVLPAGVLLFSVAAILHLLERPFAQGGLVGLLAGNFLAAWLNLIGAMVILCFLALAGFLLTTHFSLVRQLQFQADRGAAFVGWLGRKLRAIQMTRREAHRKKVETALLNPLPEAPPPVEKEETGEENPARKVISLKEDLGSYSLPPVSFLDPGIPFQTRIDKEALSGNSRLLEQTFKDFGVRGEVVGVRPGPVVTIFEFAPEPGVKVSRIAGLEDNLSMALKALAVRIIAPLPGRGVVGIEVPNGKRETVRLREILEGEAFRRSDVRLPLALGRDASGRPVVVDLARMPHLLVAGSTGSGKSVSVNAMLLSLLYSATPRDLRLLLIDPKRLELAAYERIPHLLLPVVTEAKPAALALGWAVREMERRYRLMAELGVRDIAGYNRRLAGTQLSVEETVDEEAPRHEHLPFIVVVVDELADLMMVGGRELEQGIARLAGMARAAGIHLVLATQRPSVDVVTGLIKANFPARISFRVASAVDSRTVLDQKGAETLLGQGDMLYFSPRDGDLQRVHGALVDEKEIKRVVAFLRRQGKPSYDHLEPADDDDRGREEDGPVDEKWEEAMAIILESRQTSTSMLQRRLRIGYNRAARIIERMENEGIVGPVDGGGKPREVLGGRSR